MARRYFGTDGIRGRANSQITADMALKVGQAAGLAFRRGDHRHRVVIGKDTRLSSYMIEYALVAGFTSVGADVLLLGPVPTPAVAMLTRSMRCDLGVMISASHNPYEDNGIKLFGPDGYKIVRRGRGAHRSFDGRRRRAEARQLPRPRPRQAHRRRRRPLHRIRQANALTATCRSRACASLSIAPMARVTRSRPKRCGSSAPRWSRSASSRTGSTSISRSARPRPRLWRARCAKCAPTSASRSTATPTG